MNAVLFLALIAAVPTQTAAPSPPPVVTVLPPAEVTVHAGGSAEARVGVAIRRGYHVQANPASERYLIPLTLKLEAAGPVQVGTPVYPSAKLYRLQGSEMDLLTYDGTIEVRVPLKASSDAAAAKTAAGATVRVEGTLRYQACDERVCLRPATVPVEFTVRVAPRGGAAKKASSR